MIGTTKHQSSLFYVAFGHEASLIKDDMLEPIDALLDDEALVERVRERLGTRRPNSRRLGRRGISPDRLLRLAVLKHVKCWSFRELQREVRCNLVYRRFTRFDHDHIPNFTNLSRAMAVLDPETVKQIHTRVVHMAQEKRVASGQRLRVDTTVVETNVHYPTDSTLLGDGIRVLQRAMKRIADECAPAAVKVVDHARAASLRIREIHTAARSLTDAGKQRMKDSYSGLLGIARGVVRQAAALGKQLADGAIAVTGSAHTVVGRLGEIEHFTPLAKRVIEQTKARVFGGDTHFPGKLLSLFETHTVAIRKGKAHKPTEFGRLVRVGESENGIVGGYEVADGNPADVTNFEPALSQHKEVFGRAPRVATGDRGFFSAANERAAEAAGVETVVLPARGKVSDKRKSKQHERWFRRALRWRAGIEARIATLKNRFDMARVRYKGDAGFKRGVGWSVVTQNLVSIARVLTRRKQQKERRDAERKSAA